MRRGGALLVIGIALMVVALCFAVAVAAYTIRQGESRQAITRFDKPASPSKLPKQGDLPSAPPPEPAAQEQVLSLVGEVPAANTTTLVDVKTCEGDYFTLNAAEKRMLDLHNQTRTERGLGPLCLSSILTRLARARSEDMLERDYFSHYTPEGTTVMDQMTAPTAIT
jgi:uncharacterized protein YkwD